MKHQGSFVGVLHPGAMGAAIGAQLVSAGIATAWCDQARSPATRQRADFAGLTPLPALEDLARCRVLLSICPPAAAAEVAHEVAVSGFNGIYVDANAISPRHTVEIGAMLRDRGVTVVDGGIVGPPPKRAGTTRLYLSGPPQATDTVRNLFTNTAVHVAVLDASIGHASAVKLAFATYNKLSYALAAQAYAIADAHGVSAEFAELAAEMLPCTPAAHPANLVSAGQRAWRWAGEMREIGAACDDADVPSDLLRATERIFSAWQEHKNDDGLTAEQMIQTLRAASR